MRGTVPGSIICIEMTEPERSQTGTSYEPEVTYPPTSDTVALAVCGDPVVGRVLELLLRDFNYDVRFLPVSSSSEPGMLKGVRLMLLTLTPGLSDERRKTLVASLANGATAAGIPILELVASAEEARDGGARIGIGEAVPWPCNTQDLKRRIEATLRKVPGLNRV